MLFGSGAGLPGGVAVGVFVIVAVGVEVAAALEYPYISVIRQYPHPEHVSN
jgi:hypothetical protein